MYKFSFSQTKWQLYAKFGFRLGTICLHHHDKTPFSLDFPQLFLIYYLIQRNKSVSHAKNTLSHLSHWETCLKDTIKNCKITMIDRDPNIMIDNKKGTTDLLDTLPPTKLPDIYKVSGSF
jgi:hypothetical protein